MCVEKASNVLYILIIISEQVLKQVSPAAEVGNPASLDKVFFFGIYAIISRWVWSSYPWAIKNIQDGRRKTGQICGGDVHFW